MKGISSSRARLNPICAAALTRYVPESEARSGHVPDCGRLRIRPARAGSERETLAKANTPASRMNRTRSRVDAPSDPLKKCALAPVCIAIEMLDFKALQELGALGLLEVGTSSQYPPCFAAARWNDRGPKQTAVDLVLVGKGLTFDADGRWCCHCART